MIPEDEFGELMKSMWATVRDLEKRAAQATSVEQRLELADELHALINRHFDIMERDAQGS